MNSISEVRLRDFKKKLQKQAGFRVFIFSKSKINIDFIEFYIFK